MFASYRWHNFLVSFDSDLGGSALDDCVKRFLMSREFLLIVVEIVLYWEYEISILHWSIFATEKSWNNTKMLSGTKVSAFVGARTTAYLPEIPE